MTRFYAPPDPLIESLPDRIRQAYYAAESTLIVIDGLVGEIFANRADLLHKSMGRLQAFGDKNRAAVQAVERELAVARKFVPFAWMGEPHTSAHMAAIFFGEKIADAAEEAVRPRCRLIVDIGDEENTEAAAWWANGYRDHLARFGVVTVQGDSIVAGPEWTAFREGFEEMLPSEQTNDLQTEMRLEVARIQPSTEHINEEVGAVDTGTQAKPVEPRPRKPRKAHPRWDDETKTLFLGKSKIKKYRKNAAKNQIDILLAFEMDGWAEFVDSPFKYSRTLNQTLYNLNKTLPGQTIRFLADGTGERMGWEYAT
jgi:hypothetical protein